MTSILINPLPNSLIASQKLKSFETPFTGKECLNCLAKETDKKLHECANCHIAKYCSQVCQEKDWDKHEKICDKFMHAQRDIKTIFETIDDDLCDSFLATSLYVGALAEKAFRKGYNIEEF